MEMNAVKKENGSIKEQFAGNNIFLRKSSDQKAPMQKNQFQSEPRSNPRSDSKANSQADSRTESMTESNSTTAPLVKTRGLLPRQVMNLLVKGPRMLKARQVSKAQQASNTKQDLQASGQDANTNSTDNINKPVISGKPTSSESAIHLHELTTHQQKSQESLQKHAHERSANNDYLNSNRALPSWRHKGRTILIAIRLRKITQLFNSLDPSPFLEKDLDEDAFEYIYSSVAEHPINSRLKLVIYIPVHQKKKILEDDVRIAIKNFFEYKALLTDRSISLELKEGQLSFIVGIIFLGLCLILANFISGLNQNLILKIIVEGLVIGGWVAMWKPISNILYDWWPLHKEKKIYHKISRMEVDFVYE